MLPAALTTLALAGCGGAGGPAGGTSGTSADDGSTRPAYVAAPFTHQQRLVEQGARLFVSDGCSACHAVDARHPRSGPSFAVLAGNTVTLRDGRRTLVDEAFLHAALTQPARAEVRGYVPAPMLAAVRRLGLEHNPSAVAALAAFIEQIGPETPDG
jgi:mono/diheme cytochrome c family protein